MAKVSRQIVPFDELDFNRLKIEETKENEYSKYQLLSLPKYEHADGLVTTLYIKTPLIDFNLGGLPPMKDKEGNELFKDDSERAKWRCYFSDSQNDQLFKAKIEELQEKLVKDKALICGKDAKKFEIENIVGETTTKEGETMYYVRFNFRTDGATKNMSTKFFVRKDGVDEEVMIKTPTEFESKFRRGEFRYRMIISLSKIWRQKKMPGKYGASFKVEQMLIEPRDDVVNMNTKNLFSKSQFDDSEENVAKVTKKLSDIDLSKNIIDDDEEENVQEDQEEQDEEKSEEKKAVVESEEEEEEEEIKPKSKKQVKKSEEEEEIKPKSKKQAKEEEEDEDEDEEPKTKVKVTKSSRRKGASA